MADSVVNLENEPRVAHHNRTRFQGHEGFWRDGGGGCTAVWQSLHKLSHQLNVNNKKLAWQRELPENLRAIISPNLSAPAARPSEVCGGTLRIQDGSLRVLWFRWIRQSQEKPSRRPDVHPRLLWAGEDRKNTWVSLQGVWMCPGCWGVLRPSAVATSLTQTDQGHFRFESHSCSASVEFARPSRAHVGCVPFPALSEISSKLTVTLHLMSGYGR